MPKPTKLRALNNDGILRFAEFLKQTRETEDSGGVLASAPDNLLSDPAFLEPEDFNREVDTARKFEDRAEFGLYLLGQLGDGFLQKHYLSAGVWTWFALAYFAQLRGRKTQRYEHFIPYDWFKSPTEWFPGYQPLNYRHAVRSSLEVAVHFGKDGKFFVSPKGMGSFGDASEQLLSEQWIKSNARVRALLFDLFRDKAGYVRKGALDHKLPPAKAKGSMKGYGGVRRLTDDVIPRIKLTYDIDPMPTKDLLKVCGSEFVLSKGKARKAAKPE